MSFLCILSLSSFFLIVCLTALNSLCLFLFCPVIFFCYSPFFLYRFPLNSSSYCWLPVIFASFQLNLLSCIHLFPFFCFHLFYTVCSSFYNLLGKSSPTILFPSNFLPTWSLELLLSHSFIVSDFIDNSFVWRFIGIPILIICKTMRFTLDHDSL